MSDMDDGESSAPKNRKRTESNGGSSDSELSEGWNIVDQTDVTNHDIPSSDGESVEVIDAEDEARENGMTDTEVEGDSQLSPVADTPLVSSTESEPPAVPEGNQQEEMFDSSFCWFLFFATAAVLVSNLAFMVAENAFSWNTDVNIEAPSFLRDLPTTPKPMDRNEIVTNIPWAERDEVLVEVLNDRVTGRNAGVKYNKQSQNYEMNKKQPYKQSAERFDKNPREKFNKQSYGKFNKQQNENNNQQSEKFNKGRNDKSYKDINEKLQKDSLDFDDHEIGRFFTALSEVATSSETKDKLNQILLILDALYIGLNDIEEVVTENSELHDVLRKQKHKLSQVLTEMEYGVSKSLDRVTSNVFNKVQKLERRFEKQWCELERRGHQEELKGLFYDCQENSQSEYQSNSKHSEIIKDHTGATVKENSKIDMNWNSYQYQVDKDSPGKEQRNMHSNEAEEVDEYYRLVKSDMQHNTEFSKEHANIKHESSFERKDPSEENYKSKYTDDKRKLSFDLNENKKFTDNKEKQYDDKEKYDKRNQYNDKGTHYDNKVKHDDIERTHHEDERKNNDSKERYFDGKGKHYDDKGKHYDDKGKHFNSNGKPIDGNGKFYEDKGKDYNDKEKHHDKVKHHEDKGKNYDGDGKHYNFNSKHYDDKRKHDDKEKNHDNKENNYADKWKHHNDNGKNYDVKGKIYDDKEKYAHEKGYDRKGKFPDSKRNHDDRRKFSEDKRKHGNNFETYKTYESTEHHHQNKDQTSNREGQTKSEKSFVPNSTPEVIGRYLKESCDKARNKFTKLSNMYEKLKSFIDSKLRVPKKMFDSLFAKYCQVNDESLKWDKRFNREHPKPKGDFSGKNNNNFVKDDLVITEGLNKNVKIVEMSEVSPEDEAADPVTDNIIIPNNKPKLWVFNYDEPSYDNKSNLTGDWFFKAGESRTKMRWSHHRGDWWFERASHRRNHPQSPHWFSGRRKNWYFRRAWARQNCRHSTQDGMCDFSEDETVTVPNPEFNFR